MPKLRISEIEFHNGRKEYHIEKEVTHSSYQGSYESWEKQEIFRTFKDAKERLDRILSTEIVGRRVVFSYD